MTALSWKERWKQDPRVMGFSGGYIRKRLITEACFNPRLEVTEKMFDKLSILRSISHQMLEPLGFSRDDIEIAANALCARERISTTAVGEGVAVPHAIVPKIEDLLVGWFISRRGIDWVSLDGGLTHIFICIMCAQNAAVNHLKTLTGVSALMRYAEFRATILELAEVAESSNDFRSNFENLIDALNSVVDCRSEKS
jgi:PTS system nitrogen regulatory IIA component